MAEAFPRFRFFFHANWCLRLNLIKSGVSKIWEVQMNVHYLEIITNDVDTQIQLFSLTQGLLFSDPVPELGNARVAAMPSGGEIGIRPPMHDGETPIQRPYFLVSNIVDTVKALETTTAEIALPPMEIEGRGTIAIYISDGIQYGLWQVR